MDHKKKQEKLRNKSPNNWCDAVRHELFYSYNYRPRSCKDVVASVTKNVQRSRESLMATANETYRYTKKKWCAEFIDASINLRLTQNCILRATSSAVLCFLVANQKERKKKERLR